ncbi:MAG: hypothetical protein M5U18_10065 [Dehalococcoidia bacterium]|nr:hypothetical protein [Dehalococcoidia bacterium]
MSFIWHPDSVSIIHKQRSAELARDAANARIAAGLAPRNRVERFFIKRHEGKVTWLDSVRVHRSA